MYKDMYKGYSNEDFQFAYPFHFNGNPLEYLQSNNQPMYAWDYGDAVDIGFKIDCRYSCLPITITVYDFRMEPVFEVTQRSDEEDNVYLTLTSEESKQYFKKGLYYCGIVATQQIDEETSYTTTLIAPNGCILQVV